ncbi:MAG: preprotein translocase subunit SecE [Elusimicrobia bacterium CG_4_10_14_0_8_um_filter_37_32]|nr:MAG: preprotein translocase subunit SecE [Elusimicrobia bacterium CG02_land_8_20_14_3_00_37_13]PIZ12419.1 MAG: preprotein translocase subunit SecE [Elusimicrobia bacterium CG_4_10_14_0_8_um_filter_37_32]
MNKAIHFVKEAYAELKKVSWLGRKEVMASTVVVIVFILVVALYVGFIDFILARILGIFLRGY